MYIPDASLDKAAQLFNQSVVSARVVEHHNCSVLNIVKPSLGRYKPVKK